MLIKLLVSIIFRSLAFSGLIYNLWSISEIFFKFQITTEISIQIPRTYEPLDVHFCVRYTDLISSKLKKKLLQNWNHLNVTNEIRILQYAIQLNEIFYDTPNETLLFDHVEFREKGSYELIICNSSYCNEYFNVTRFVFMEYICYQISLRSDKISQSFDLINLAVSPAFSGLSVRITFNKIFNFVQFFKVALSRPGDYPYTELAVAPQRFGDHNLMVGYKSLKSKLLPSPYTSNCFDYKQIAFNSRDDCYSKCVFEKTIEKIYKLPFAVILDDNYNKRIVSYIDIQEKKVSQIVQSIHDQCSLKCRKRDCYKESLTTLVMPLSTDSETFVIATAVPSDPEVDVRTSPKMSLIEFIIFFLSSISTWTSLSIMSLNPAELFSKESLTRIINNFTFQNNQEISSIFNRQFNLNNLTNSRSIVLPLVNYRPPAKVHYFR